MFCFNRGSKLVADAKFCANCGKQVISLNSVNDYVEREMVDDVPLPLHVHSGGAEAHSETRHESGKERPPQHIGSDPMEDESVAKVQAECIAQAGSLLANERTYTQEKVFYSGPMGAVRDISFYIRAKKEWGIFKSINDS